MSIERDSPEGIWLRHRWNSMAELAHAAAEYTKWIVTGIGIVLSVLLTSIDSLSKRIDPTFLKLGFCILVLALILASYSYLHTLSIKAGAEISKKLGEKDKEEKGEVVISSALLEEFRSPFWGLIGRVVRKSMKKGTKDPFYGEKKQISRICLSNLLILSTIALSGSALILLAIGFYMHPVQSAEISKEPNQTVDTTAANARLLDNDTSKSTNPDVVAKPEAAVVSP